MPRQFIARDGRVLYRTKLLSYDAARRFEQMVKANGRFADVEFCISDRTTAYECCYVTYRPTNPERQMGAALRERDKRIARAADEGLFYLWALDTDGPRPFYHCASLSGECYEVTNSTCTCPDYEFRCSRSYAAGCDVRCKHVRALEMAYESGELVPLSHVRPQPAQTWPVPPVVNVPVNSNDEDSFTEPVRYTRTDAEFSARVAADF